MMAAEWAAAHLHSAYHRLSRRKLSQKNMTVICSAQKQQLNAGVHHADLDMIVAPGTHLDRCVSQPAAAHCHTP
jgi:hypothetical protein